MNFLAYLVISLTQLTPLGLAQTNVAIPTPDMATCQEYLDSAKEHVMFVSNLQVVQSTANCVDSKDLEVEQEEPKADPGKTG